MKQEIYLLVGVPGSGKTWITNQVGHKFHFIHHDGFIYLKQPGAYLRAILEQAPTAQKPILIEAPFSIRETMEPLQAAGYNVKPVFILEEPEVVTLRYLKREGKMIPKGHLTRMKTYADRARGSGGFAGTSEQVLRHLEGI